MECMPQGITHSSNHQSEAGQGCGGKRSPRAQRFTWDVDGNPNFGIPLSTTTAISVPSGVN
jgi:GH43 family beta-xylosidase